MPLPYHHEVWVPHKLLPHFEDECRSNPTDPTKCHYYDYIGYTLTNLFDILGAKGTTEKDIIEMWTAKIATKFNI